MDKVSEFFKELKDRSSSPLFSSFAISWLITNWKIPVILMKYDSKDFSEMKMKGAIDYIMHLEIPWYQLWGIPAGSAILYTFGYPYLKNFISAFNAKRRKEGSNAVLKYSENGSISINRYLLLRKEYMDRTKRLQEIIKEESSLQIRYSQLESKIFGLEERILELKQKDEKSAQDMTQVKKYNTSLSDSNKELTRDKERLILQAEEYEPERAIKRFSGQWHYASENGGPNALVIKEDKITYLGGELEGKPPETEEIRIFQVLPNVNLIKMLTYGSGQYKYYILTIEDRNRNKLSGSVGNIRFFLNRM
ncbi:hypothetical protein [Taibaiella chishuiensis]|uniref:Uncharacterized protein n=1 Tax=Taibaiella chishuiensis TaxID=1434707 RepID=A0A2P8D334_9BACT|nr:hypothetical protein [Taibaiella chishuiensis]PSK91589.1 hypothetical protein B0I18_105174 [Taibaiella chishuiensis]